MPIHEHSHPGSHGHAHAKPSTGETHTGTITRTSTNTATPAEGMVIPTALSTSHSCPTTGDSGPSNGPYRPLHHRCLATGRGDPISQRSAVRRYHSQLR